jgi:beta-glucanase (GH16 family)/Ca2+-binding RTX toxin-like protein
MPVYRDFFGAILPQSATPTETITGAGYIEGSSGADLMVGGGGDTMAGLGGDDSYQVMAATDAVSEQPGQGVDTVQVRNVGQYVLPDNVENMSLFGKMTAVGNSEDNIIVGNGSAQRLTGGAGNDVLTGAGGPDVFIFAPGSGYDVVTDFNSNQADKLDIQQYGFTSFDQVTAAMTQSGADVVLALSPTDAVKILNRTVASLHATDFLLGEDTSNLRPTFSDEFNGPLSLYDAASGTGVWNPAFSTGEFTGPRAYTSHTLRTNNEKELYVDPSFPGWGETPVGVNPFSVAGGVLTISARPTSDAAKEDLWYYKYTSGLLTTANSFSQTYGYFEVRAQMPAGQGVWPAFWLLPSSFSSPPELDVVEQIGGTTSYFTSHSATEGVTGFTFDVPGNTTAFHTYGVLWGTKTLTWYVDGQSVASTPTPDDMRGPMYLLLNLAIGGGFPGDPPSNFKGADFKVDYVRAYALDAKGGEDDDFAVWLDQPTIGTDRLDKTAFTLTGLDPGAVATLTFSDGAGHSVTVTTSANGRQMADLSALAPGAASVSIVEALAAGGQATGLGQSFAIDPGVDTDLHVDLPYVFGGPTIASAKFNLGGLDPGFTGTVTFTDTQGHVATATTSSNGLFSVDLSGLVDGVIQVSTSDSDGAVTRTGAAGSFNFDSVGDLHADLALSVPALVTGANRSKLAFQLLGLDKDAAGTITFQDAQGHVVTTVVNNDSVPFVDLSSLSDGDITVSATTIDDAGNTAQAATVHLHMDSTADVGGDLAVATPAAVTGVMRAATHFVVSGLDADATAVVTFVDQAGGRVTAVAQGNGDGVADLSGLVDGPVSVSIRATDLVGNNANGAGGGLTLDPEAPGVGPTAVVGAGVADPYQSGYVPVDVAGLAAGESAHLSFTDSRGGVIELAAGNGEIRADLRALAAGAVTVALKVDDGLGGVQTFDAGQLTLAPGHGELSGLGPVILAPDAGGQIIGSAGADLIVAGPGADFISGGGGADTVSYDRSTAGVSVNLPTGVVKGSGGDVLNGVQNLIGSAFNDTLTGDAHANLLIGGGSSDTLKGGDGDDVLAGGAGDDRLVGGAGLDTASYFDAPGGVTVDLRRLDAQDTGAGGHDILSSIENLTGSSFADSLTGSSVANRLDGGAGDDTLVGLSGADTLFGGAGADTFVYLTTADSKTAAGKQDVILDFDGAAGDRIDLSAIDANSHTPGDDAFTFAPAFTHVPGQLIALAQPDGYLVEGDVNGDAKPDFALIVHTTSLLGPGDFIL